MNASLSIKLVLPIIDEFYERNRVIFLNERKAGGRLSWQKLYSAFCIFPEGGWAAPLLDPCRQRLISLPDVQGEGEGGADGDGELKHFALACQCLAEV